MAKTREEMIEELKEIDVNVPHNIGDEKLLEKYNENFVPVEEEEGEDEVNDAPVVETGSDEQPDTLKVILHSNDKENEETEAQIGHNGKMHQIRLGVEVDVERDLLRVIKDATETRYRSILDTKGQPTGEMEEYQRSRYLIESVI